MKLRVLLGEAAHFVADSACALGRKTIHEVLPLFLIGIDKLNNILRLMEEKPSPSVDEPKLLLAESSLYGTALMRSALMNLGSPGAKWSWDVLEVHVKSESTVTAQKLFSGLVGKYLPESTGIYVSTHLPGFVKLPCVLIHPHQGMRGQTYAVHSGVRRTVAFLRDGGVPEEAIDQLRVVAITSTGSSARSQLTGRDNDKLLTPGPWGLSPLELSLLQANQFVFPQPGRWVIENDSFFVLSRPLRPTGNDLCLLTLKRRPTSSSSSWRVCIESTDEVDGCTFMTGFRDIRPDEIDKKLLRATNATFIPQHLAHSLARKESNHADRLSPFLFDVVLPRYMHRLDWIRLCHSQGCGINFDLAWKNCEQPAALSPKVELAYGGDELEFYHFGSDREYTKFIAGVGKNPTLHSLSYAPAVAKWRREHVLSRFGGRA